MQFFTDPIVWILILAALVSGGLLLWPSLSGARAGGVAPTEVVRLMNREKATVIDVSEPGEYAACAKTDFDEFSTSTLRS